MKLKPIRRGDTGAVLPLEHARYWKVGKQAAVWEQGFVGLKEITALVYLIKKKKELEKQ